MRLKTFSKERDIIIWTEQQPIKEEKIFTKFTYNRGVISKKKGTQETKNQNPKQSNLKMRYIFKQIF